MQFSQDRESRITVVQTRSGIGLPVSPLGVPTDTNIAGLLERCLCRVRMGEDCYIVSGSGGGEEKIPFGAPVSRWVDVCSDLLRKALDDR